MRVRPIYLLLGLAGFAGLSQAQNAGQTCTFNAAGTPTVRAEGRTELMGDALVACTGGTPTSAGQPVPQANITLFLNTNITSRVLSNPFTEVLLLVDEPNSAANPNVPLSPCDPTNATLGVCSILGTGTGAGTYNGSAGRPNVFQARLTGVNQVTFFGVPIDPPGQSGSRYFRIMNIRGDASTLVGGSGAPQVVAALSVTPPSLLPLNNAQQTLAFAVGGLASVRDANDAAPAPNGNSVPLAPAANRVRFGTLRFSETFASDAKPRTAAPYINADTSPPPVDQNSPSANYFSESGFLSGSFPAARNLVAAGLADSGTRLYAVFNNIPQGVSVFVDIYNTTAANGPTARLVSTDAAGAGAFTPVPGTNNLAQLSVVNGSAIAVWEVLRANPFQVEAFDFGVYLSYPANFASAAPSPITVQMNLGPVSTVGTASSTEPIPRFANIAPTRTLFTFAALPLSVGGSCPVPRGIQGVTYTGFKVPVSGGAPPYTFATSLPPGLNYDPVTGAVAGIPQSSGNFPFLIQASDSGVGPQQQTVTYTCAIQVVAPLSIAGPCPVPQGLQGAAYSGFSVRTSGGTGPYTYSTSLPPGLTFDVETGTVGGTLSFSGTLPISIQVTDSGIAPVQQSRTYSCQVTSIPVLAITSGCPAAGTVNSAFQYTTTATGGVPPYSFTLVNGPAGLALNPLTGVVSGIPAVSGTSPFTTRVTDSAAASLQQSKTLICAISINPQPTQTTTQLQIVSGCPASPAAQGVPYAQTLTASGGDGAFIWSIATGSLPAGLNLIGNKIGGSPSGPPGASNFTIQVSSGDQTLTQSCSLVVTGPKLQLTSGCPADATQGVPYTFVLGAAAGAGPGTYSFSIANGSLPAGLSLNGNTIGGTPQGPAGVSTFSIQVASGTETATSGPCSMNVNSTALSIRGTCPATAQVGTTVSAPVTAAGGKPPYTYSFTGSPWLSFNNEAVSGTPPAVGAGAFTVTVTDAANSPAKTLSCSFPITASGLQIAGSCPAGATLPNAPFNLSLTGSGGQAPYTWTLSGPSWLSLSSTTGSGITLSGTPPVAGSFPFSVTLSDSVGSPVASFRCTLTVAVPLQFSASSGCPSSPLVFQSAISPVSLSASGGVAPYTWTVNGPPWLSLSNASGAATVLSGTASTAGAASFSVTLSDSANTPSPAFSCTLVVNLRPTVTITSPGPSNSGQDVPIGVSLGSVYPSDVQGRLTLTFAPDANLPDDPAIQFQNGLRTFDFNVPAGSSTQPQVALKTGTVAGVVTIAPTLTSGGADVTPPGLVPQRIQIGRAAPTITAVDCVRTSASAFNVIVDGYSNTREAVSASYTFVPAAGANLGTTQLQVAASPFFSSWFGSAGSNLAGGNFRYTQSFNVQGSAADIASVAVRLTNGVGQSVAQSAAACRAQ